MNNNFSQEKKRILDKLGNLKQRLISIESNYEINLESIKTKLDKAINNIQNEKISIAFFGAFSDGKSSILSAITKRLDIAVAPEPMTDKIKTYTYQDYFIIDTPGLYSENLLHDSLTNKYISESNIVLYAIDSVNPLKESHHNIIKWLLNNLDKLSSTIFVINKMDEVSDLEDEEDYIRNSEIKKKVVYDTLDSLVDLKIPPKIVCISANPFDSGLEFWLSDMENYYKLSRIETLISEIDNFVDQSKDELVLKAGFSVVKDAIRSTLQELYELRENIVKQVELFSNQKSEIENKLNNFVKDVNKKYINIKEEVINFREDIISSINSSCDITDLRNKITSKIGEEGYLLNERINLIIQKYSQSLFDEQKRVLNDIEISLNFHKEMQDKIIKMSSNVCAKLGQKILSQSSRTLADTILNIRDVSKLPIEFKPWGAIKWGERLLKFGKFLEALPIIVDGLAVVKSIYDEYKFAREKGKIVDEIESLFKEFIISFTLDEYTANYFPIIKETSSIKTNIYTLFDNYTQLKEKLDNSIHELERNQTL